MVAIFSFGNRCNYTETENEDGDENEDDGGYISDAQEYLSLRPAF